MQARRDGPGQRRQSFWRLVCAARLALTTVVALTAVVAVAAPARAGESCNPSLVDSGGFAWPVTLEGAVNGGENKAFSSYGYLTVNSTRFPSGMNYCAWENDRREMVYPSATSSDGRLTFTRKVFASATRANRPTRLGLSHPRRPDR